ncbi:unnamed protein product, partial [marine sediment metagenome]
VNVPPTYAEDEIWALDFAQKDDVLNITHPLHAPARLIRTSVPSGIGFYLEDFTFQVMPFEELNADKDKKVTIAGSGEVQDPPSLATVTPNWDMFVAGDVGRVLRIGDKRNDDGRVGYVLIDTFVNEQNVAVYV